MVNKHNVYNVGLKESENCPLPSHRGPKLPIRTPNDNTPVVIDPRTGLLYTRDPQVSPADLEAAENRLGERLEQKVEEETKDVVKKGETSVASAPDKVVVRDSAGHINIQYPTAGSHGANKQYVDDEVDALKETIRDNKETTDTSVSQIAEDVDNKYNLAIDYTDSFKEEVKEDYVNKNEVNVSSVPDTIVRRDGSRRINIGYPIEPDHGVNKQYVLDALEALKNSINNVSAGGVTFVYDTFEQFINNVLVENNVLVSITDEDNKIHLANSIPLGANILIREELVPDYWLSRKEITAFENKVSLFTQYEAKINLDDYYNKNEADSKFDEKLDNFKHLTGAEIENGTFENGEIIWCTASSDFFSANKYYIYNNGVFNPISIGSTVSITPSISAFNVTISTGSTLELGASFTITGFSGTLKKYSDFAKLTVTAEGLTVGEITNITSSSFSMSGLSTTITKNSHSSTAVSANIKGYNASGTQIGSANKLLVNYWARQYFGIAPDNPSLETMTTELATSYYKNITENTDEIKTYLQGARPNSITLNLSNTPTYVWFIIPSNLNISKMTSGGFDFPFIQQDEVTINNRFGINITYKVYRSANKIYGTTTINLS